MSELIVTHRGVVYPWQCDHMGHMNVMWYVGKFDEASWQLLATLGLTMSFLREQQRAMAAVQQELSYLRELHAGDPVAVSSRVLEVREKVLRLSHEMQNLDTGEIAARTTITAVHLDAYLRKSCPFPQVVLERARTLLQECAADGGATRGAPREESKTHRP